jgi:elongation factor Ts
MTKVTMDLVKELREKTQVGMMACKKALEDADGDLEKAIELLRKQGAAVAAKRAEHATNHGRIEAYLSSDFKQGSLVEVSCETDFSASTEAMKTFALMAAENATQSQCTQPEELLTTHKPLQNNLNELIAKISEKIFINRISCFKVQTFGVVNAYIHPGSTIGSLIELTAQQDLSRDFEILQALARDLCMHIAVTNPIWIHPQEVDAAVIEKEKVIAREQLKDSKKPAAIIEKIVEGKLNKYFEDACLAKQRFIKNEDLTIEQYLKDISEKLKNTITIKRFTRFAVGK